MLRPGDVTSENLAHQHILQGVIAIPGQRRRPPAAAAVKPSGRYRRTYRGLATGTYRITPRGRTTQPDTALRSVVTAPITTPSRNSRAEWSWSSMRMSKRTSPSSANTAVNQVAIESALTANAILGVSTLPPPISASASDSSISVWAASRNNGAPAGVAEHGFSRTTSTWPTAVRGP